jgi:hypothetical protein
MDWQRLIKLLIILDFTDNSMDEIWYKGYKIMPATVQLVESGEWTIALYIGLDKGSEWVERYFSAANKYKTKKEAISHCINFGKQIIDGESKNCTAADL